MVPSDCRGMAAAQDIGQYLCQDASAALAASKIPLPPEHILPSRTARPAVQPADILPITPTLRGRLISVLPAPQPTRMATYHHLGHDIVAATYL